MVRTLLFQRNNPQHFNKNKCLFLHLCIAGLFLEQVNLIENLRDCPNILSFVLVHEPSMAKFTAIKLQAHSEITNNYSINFKALYNLLYPVLHLFFTKQKCKTHLF